MSGVFLSFSGIAIAQLVLPWEKDKNKDKGAGGATTPATTMTPANPPATSEIPATTPISPQPDPAQPAVSQGPNLFQGGDFSGAGAVEGDGGLVRFGSADGNGAWRLVGPDDMSFSKALAPTPGSGGIVVKFRLLVPSDTGADPQLKGIRIRARLMDRHQSSAINDRVVQPGGQWETVQLSFTDTGSGPYTLGLEAFGFTGPIYFDDIEVRMGGTAPGAAAAQTLEDWFAALPWMRSLAASLPAGVTMNLTTGGDDDPAGFTTVEVRETHSPDSGFDPNTSPLVGIFLVSDDRQTVRWLNSLTGEWDSVEAFTASR